MDGDLWIAIVTFLDCHGSRFCDMLSLPCLRSTLAGASKDDCGMNSTRPATSGTASAKQPW